mmetsp:Transcript_31360/g.94212  ORF Transcript_31360/g.94212 Transcript_31360/m.94212 type:complete len:239 (-) Transcript_31360:593-1309(-)
MFLDDSHNMQGRGTTQIASVTPHCKHVDSTAAIVHVHPKIRAVHMHHGRCTAEQHRVPTEANAQVDEPPSNQRRQSGRDLILGLLRQIPQSNGRICAFGILSKHPEPSREFSDVWEERRENVRSPGESFKRKAEVKRRQKWQNLRLVAFFNNIRSCLCTVTDRRVNIAQSSADVGRVYTHSLEVGADRVVGVIAHEWPPGNSVVWMQQRAKQPAEPRHGFEDNLPPRPSHNAERFQCG